MSLQIDRSRTLKGALAGASAAAVWALQQPLDKRSFACDYDDVELLGKLVTPGKLWYPVGLMMHIQNGAFFGATYANLAPKLPLPPSTRGPFVALAEHLALWPLGRVTDRYHPRRGELPVLSGNRKAFWQAAWRHAMFGLTLGELERQLNRPSKTNCRGLLGRCKRTKLRSRTPRLRCSRG